MHVHILGNIKSGIDERRGKLHYHKFGNSISSFSEDNPYHTHRVGSNVSGLPMEISKAEGNDKEMTVTAKQGITTMEYKTKPQLPLNVPMNDVGDGLSEFKDMRPTYAFIFPPDHMRVNDNKGHFPINNVAHARNALARVAQYKAVPVWYDGTLSDLVRSVKNAVKRKFPSIKVN